MMVTWVCRRFSFKIIFDDDGDNTLVDGDVDGGSNDDEW